jgi:uncharacterized membrane protein
MSNHSHRSRIPWPTIAMWILVSAYAVFFSAASIQKHLAFQSTDFDLGNLSQVVWNTLHGRPFLLTNPEGTQPEMSLGIHVWPILLLIAPLYLVWSDPRVLLILQSVVIALGAWPVYWLARDVLPDPFARSRIPILPLAFAVVYLCFPALQSANMFDFHPLALAPTLLLLAFYALERGRWAFYALWAILAMACQEDVALMVGMMGLYLILRRQWRAGLVTIVVSAAWFAVAVGVILPYFDTAGASPLASRYQYLGDNPLEMALTIVTRPGVVLGALLTPQNLAYLRDLLVPVGFLSLLAPQVLMISLPPVLTNLLSTKDLMHFLEGFHYSVNAVPFVVVSAAYGAAWLVRRFARHQLRRWVAPVLAAFVLVCSLAYHVGHGYTPIGGRFSWPEVTEHHRLGEAMARQIPADASLTAGRRLHPHASNRPRMYAVNQLENGQLVRVDGVDYVWLDVTNSWPLHPNDLKAGIEDLLAGEYGVEQASDGWILLRLGAPAKELPDTFYDFGRTSDPQPQYAMRLQFLLDGEPVLECLGFDLILEASSSTLQFYWRALRPLPADLNLYPFYFDDATGEILEDTSLRPMIAPVWYPPERWQVGEIVVTRTLPWDVGPTFTVGLGVVQGEEWESVERRLPIYVESSDLVIRLFDGDTWARLLYVEEGEPVEEYRLSAIPSMQSPSDADFASQIRLLGYDLDCDGRLGACELRLYWQAQTRPQANYAIFVQLLDPSGNVRTQVDSVPQGGGYPTIWWLPGEIVADTYTLKLPPDAPGDLVYQLIVGWYDPATGVRLPVSETGTDFATLTTIEP